MSQPNLNVFNDGDSNNKMGVIAEQPTFFVKTTQSLLLVSSKVQGRKT